MPEVGVKCKCKPSGAPWDSCIICASSGRGVQHHCQWSPEILAAMKPGERDEAIHVTEVCSSCLRRTYFMRTVGYYVTPENAYWRARGSLMHTGIQATGYRPDLWIEREVRGVIDGIDVVGRIDCYDPLTQTLRDFKTTKRCPDRRARNGYVTPWDDHVAQVNVYKLLLEENGVAVKHLEVVYLDMETSIRCLCPTWERKKVVDYLRRQVRQLSEALQSKVAPPYSWCFLCEGYCDVKDTCHAHLENELNALKLEE